MRFSRSLPLLMTLLPAGLTAQGPIGLWGGEVAGVPALSGQLVLARHDGVWHANLAGLEAATRSTRDSVLIAFPADQGTLRVQGLDRTGTPRAFWIQPAGALPPYATPVRLVAAGDDTWRGAVDPLASRFSLYLRIRRDSTGALRGVFRNPEANWGRWLRNLRVEVRDGALAFLDDRGQQQLVQPYDSATATITFDFGSPLLLTRRTPATAPGYTPRIAPGRYAYRLPADLGDGWPVAAASEEGVDPLRLESVVRDIIAADPASDTAPRIHSLVVARHGKLVLDEYFRGHAADRLHDLRSASKSFTSVMFGIAMAAHPALDPGTTVRSIFPASAIDSTITVGQLLSHSSGLACDDNDDDSPGLEDRMQEVSRDWYGFALGLPQAHPPGSSYAYCSAGINLVGGMIAAVTGAWLPDYFDRQLAEPMQIDHYAMNLMPDGQGYSAGGIHLRPRDFLKFGEVMLRDGRWQGRPVVSAGWVRRSTAHQVDLPDGSSDGYGWHRHRLVVGDRTLETFEASGNGGQFMLVVPALDLAVVVTAGNYGQYGVWRTIREAVIPEVIGAAIAR